MGTKKKRKFTVSASIGETDQSHSWELVGERQARSLGAFLEGLSVPGLVVDVFRALKDLEAERAEERRLDELEEKLNPQFSDEMLEQ